MSDEDQPTARGALAGWRREPSEGGFVLRLKLASSLEAYHSQTFERVDVSMNDRQLRSFARDLMRAASERNLDLEAKPRVFSLSALKNIRFWKRLSRQPTVS